MGEIAAPAQWRSHVSCGYLTEHTMSSWLSLRLGAVLVVERALS